MKPGILERTFTKCSTLVDTTRRVLETKIEEVAADILGGLETT
jgi:hypothetical protein